VPLADLQAALADHGELSAEFPFEPDLTISRVARHIDGARSVDEVVVASGLPQEHVLICLRHLVHFGLVAVIDGITLTSRYWLTPEFHVAFDRPEVVMEVVRYVTAGKHEGNSMLVQVVQGLYVGVDGWRQTLGEFQLANSAELQEHGISLRHFITFGLLRGFLERIDSRNQALSDEEASELEELRSVLIPNKKQELKQLGKLTSAEVNKDLEIVRMVARLNELKAKEKNRPSPNEMPMSGAETDDDSSTAMHQLGSID